MNFDLLVQRLENYLKLFLPHLLETKATSGERSSQNTTLSGDLVLAKTIWDKLYESNQHYELGISIRENKQNADGHEFDINLRKWLEVLLKGNAQLSVVVERLLDETTENVSIHLALETIKSESSYNLSPEAIKAWRRSNTGLSLLEFLSTTDGRHDR